jgi:hypothetical protein
MLPDLFDFLPEFSSEPPIEIVPESKKDSKVHVPVLDLSSIKRFNKGSPSKQNVE